MTKYTKEERNEYFRSLRKRWSESKKLAENDEVVKALYKEVGGDFSYTSFYMTLQEMKSKGLDGIPYIDCKTFDGWKKAGFIVKKGEHHLLTGMTWLGFKDEEDEEEDRIYPKIYNLFHRSQVEPIEVKVEVGIDK